MFFSMKHKLLFVHVPKAAGTAVGMTLAAATLRPANRFKLGYLPRLEGPMLAHLTAETMRGLLRHDIAWRKLYKFAVARNPWARYVSLYFHFKRSARRARSTPYRSRMIDLAVKLKFSDWAGMYLGGPYCEPLEHYTHSLTGEQLVDDIIRLNELGTELPAILEKLGLPGISVTPTNRRPDRLPFQAYYDAAIKEKVAETCRKEIERFEFTFDDPTES